MQASADLGRSLASGGQFLGSMQLWTWYESWTRQKAITCLRGRFLYKLSPIPDIRQHGNLPEMVWYSDLKKKQKSTKIENNFYLDHLYYGSPPSARLLITCSAIHLDVHYNRHSYWEIINFNQDILWAKIIELYFLLPNTNIIHCTSISCPVWNSGGVGGAGGGRRTRANGNLKEQMKFPFFIFLRWRTTCSQAANHVQRQAWFRRRRRRWRKLCSRRHSRPAPPPAACRSCCWQPPPPTWCQPPAITWKLLNLSLSGFLFTLQYWQVSRAL